ncbi:MAG: N-glycosylase, partial [Candidatus Hermodarchaeota archaeon]
DWLVKNVKGIGYKEASHFLRNIGYTEYAIVDFHIVDLLVKHNFIEKPKTMTKSKYLEIEKILKSIGSELELNMAELDLYLWYLETGKILK